MTRPPDYDIRSRHVPARHFASRRVRFSLGPGSARQHRARRAACDEIRRWGAWDVLAAAARGEISATDIHHAVRSSGEGAVSELRRLVVRLDDLPTVADVAADLERHIELRGLSSATMDGLRSKRRIVTAAIGSVRIDSIAPEQAERVVGIGANGQKLGLGTRNIRAVYLRRLVAFAHNAEQRISISRNQPPRWPLYYPVNMNGSPDTVVRVVTNDELSALLGAATPHQAAYLRSFVRLGLRARELIHTRYGVDFDPDRWEWHIQPRGPDPICGCPYCAERGWRPKNRRGHRTLNLSHDALAGFRDAIERYGRQYPPKRGEYLFRNPRTGRIWRYNTLKLDFYNLCRRAGVTHGRGAVTLHALRHTCATNLIRAGVLETIVAGILGDTIQMISATYVHPTADDLGAGIARVIPFD